MTLIQHFRILTNSLLDEERERNGIEAAKQAQGLSRAVDTTYAG